MVCFIFVYKHNNWIVRGTVFLGYMVKYINTVHLHYMAWTLIQKYGHVEYTGKNHGYFCQNVVDTLY